jgi:hypothetical protein
MRSKEAFAYSRSTGYFCLVPASTGRVSGLSKRPDPPTEARRAGTFHDGQVAGRVMANWLTLGPAAGSCRRCRE